MELSIFMTEYQWISILVLVSISWYFKLICSQLIFCVIQGRAADSVVVSQKVVQVCMCTCWTNWMKPSLALIQCLVSQHLTPWLLNHYPTHSLNLPPRSTLWQIPLVIVWFLYIVGKSLCAFKNHSNKPACLYNIDETHDCITQSNCG